MELHSSWGVYTYLPQCAGKKILPNTPISILSSLGHPHPYRNHKTLPLCCTRKIWPRIKCHSWFLWRCFDVLIFVNSGIEQYRRFHILPLFFFNMKSCQQIYFSGLIHPPRGNFLGGLKGYKKCLISGLYCTEWAPASSSLQFTHSLSH